MKINYLLFIFIGILFSCSTQENRVRIYSSENEYYSIEISTIDTKVNKNGEAQCSKHMTVSYSDSLYVNYGNDLQHLLAGAHETSAKYIQLNTPDSLKGKYFDIKIHNKTLEQVEYEKELIHHIKEALSLTITAKDSLVNGYKLSVVNDKQLQKHLSPCSNGTIKYEDYRFFINGSRLYSLPKIIDEQTSHFVNFEIPNNECYSLTFKVEEEVQKMNEELKESGLALIPSTFTQTFFEIR